MKEQIMEVYLDDIIPNRFQPREKFNEESINALANSIKRYGVIQPLVLRKIGDKFEIIAGERRYKASTLAGLEKVPAIIKELGDMDSAEVALIENLQREDLTPIEKARSYNKLLSMNEETQETLAEKLGISQSALSNSLRLLNLDESVQKALLDREISERHARSLLKVEDKNKQKELLDKIVNERLTVRRLDMLIDGNEENESSEEPEVMIKNPTESLGETLGAEVVSVPDIEEIKETAQDLEQEKPKPDFNMLLKTAGEENNKLDEQAPNMSLQEDEEPEEEKTNFNIFGGKTFDESIEEPVMNPVLEPQPIEEPSSNPEPIPDLMATPKTIEEPQPVFNPEPISVTPSPTIESQPVAETIAEPPLGMDSSQSIRTAINTLRQSVETIEKFGFKIDSEELDLENNYQFVINISKNKE